MNRDSAKGKSFSGFPVSAPSKTQISRHGIGKSAADSNRAADKVDETIKLFRKALSEVRLQNKSNANSFKDHMKAAISLRDNGKWLNTENHVGAIPGVKVSDHFQCRAEMRVIGLHCQFQKGIDYKEINGRKLVTSIVDSGRYSKTQHSSSPDVIIYTGEGGNPITQKTGKLKDQKLKGGNQALQNSMMVKNPIRLIIKVKNLWGYADKFVYQGLYIVEDYKLVRGKYGKLVYEFTLVRMKQQEKPQASQTRGVTEKPPIPATNALKTEKLSVCSCKIKNGGTFELETFRCRLGFLGVRSRCFIQKGSFVCEYEKGIGKFINRSTSPNLSAKKVVHNCHLRTHMLLFAMEDIPGMTELTIGLGIQ